MHSFKFEVSDGAQIAKLTPLPCAPRQPEGNEILVRVEASSLNFHDFLVVAGMIKAPAGRIPLSDGVGIVEACGPNAKRFAPGTRVMGTFFPDWLSGDPSPSHVARMRGEHVDGFAASYVTMAEAGFTRVPQGLTPVEAATLPCAALTAWRALFVEGNLRPGETVLIQGSGGVSLFALQFARVAGAQVIATTSSDVKAEKLRAMGAHVVVDRNNAQWGDAVRDHVPGGVDHVIEVAGGDLSQSLQSLRVGGRLCLVGVLSRKPIQFSPIHMIHANRRIGGITVGSRDHQDAMVAAVELHGIKPVVDSVYPMSGLRDAFEYFQSQQHFGKIAIAAGPTVPE
jgi:NADPH:quinone reductase-like Zn-dependent oxidoreductase